MAGTITRCLVGMSALTLMLLLGADGTARTQLKKSDSVVKVEAKADGKPDVDGKQSITITLDIEKDWHVYANPVKNDIVANGQTEVRVSSKAKLEDVKIVYPSGKAYGEGETKCQVYEGKVTIKAQVKRARGDNGPLEVSVQLSACNASRCLPPATVKKEIR
jgi:DsbC/DsbD-like thiol-disulfide interchange protein